ncbi:MAG: sulfite exporter TauE/SafE family protein [Gammaproteobacteria bacterium]|jgi:uncharacterized protein|nr:sulfite exporter TauE/SafE family protein [Gammaproteobacteria bacterium]
MSIEPLYLSAFIMGLLGTTHCAGMCGGIVSALSLGIPASQRSSRRSLIPFLLAYNGGRILSYALAGLLVASLGGVLGSLGEGMVIRTLFGLLSSILMILLGFYLIGWWRRAILLLEQAGGRVWRNIEPYAQRFIPIRSLSQAGMAGILWGWLPCGLVYTALTWTLTSESPLEGALLMVSFGLGTLPALLGLGYFSSALVAHLQKQWLRTTTGIMVAGFGLYQLWLLDL